MSDLVERLNARSDALLLFKLVAGETVTNRVYSECVETARVAADYMREAAAELARRAAEVATAKADRNNYDSAHKAEAANVLRLTAEVERYRSAIRWALGYDEGEPEFRERRDGDKPYYWRTELARRAGAGVRDIKEAGNG